MSAHTHKHRWTKRMREKESEREFEVGRRALLSSFYQFKRIGVPPVANSVIGREKQIINVEP